MDFFHSEEEERLNFSILGSGGSLAKRRPDVYRMSVVDVEGKPIKSCKIDQDQIGYSVYADLWNSASKSTRLGDSSLKELMEMVEEIA